MLLISGCNTLGGTSSRDGSGPTTSKPGAPVVTAEQPQPTPVPVAPAPPTCNDKYKSQQRAIEAVTLLERGDSPKAEQAVEEALSCDPKNELALKLRPQFHKDVTQWARETSDGKTITCPIRSGDSLSRFAETYLGEKYSFWILARYNGIAVPSQVRVNQLIKIPSRRTCASVVSRPVIEPSTEPLAQPSDRKAEAAVLIEEAKAAVAAAKYEDAMAKAHAALQKDPSSEDARAVVQLAKSKRADALIKQARDARTMQRPALEYRSWSEVLKVDPENRTALSEIEGARQRWCKYDPKQCPPP